MHVRTLAIAVFSLLLAGNVAWTQTPEIQKQVEKKLGELKKVQAKKERGTLEDLLAQALKNNPDIRVAESKLHEAEAELYRARMKVFNRIVALQQEVKSLQAELDQAKQGYERVFELFKTGAVPNATVDQKAVSLQKATSELARAEAEMDLLVGKHNAKAAEWLLAELLTDNWSRPYDTGFLTKPLPPSRLHDTGFIFAPVPGTMADKIRKALDVSVQVDNAADFIDGAAVLDLLRKRALGVNIQDKLAHHDDNVKAKLSLKEPVPLGAFFQWAEDQFDWCFIVREYGIVVTDRKNIPPGGLLLLDFWRKGAAAAAPK